MSTDNVTDSEVRNAHRAEWERKRAEWEASDTYAQLTREAEAAALRQERQRLYRLALLDARDAAHAVGCGTFDPGMAHCLEELTAFIERAARTTTAANR